MTEPFLDHFFKPQAVAVVGASPREASIGFTLVNNLKKSGFPGKVYPINPKHEEILGLKTYPSLAAVQAPIDLVIIAVPIKGVPAILRECGAAKVPGAIIISAGGKETGAAGVEIEAEIKAAAQQGGVRYLGPNCLGILSPSQKLDASFAGIEANPGSLALLSQSGAICSAILDWAAVANIGFSHFVSVGSMADIDFADMIDYLGNDEKAKSIIIYMENLIHHRRFMSAARSVSRAKPIIVVKSGRSRAAAKAAASHTGALAGQDETYNAAFRRAGIIRVDTISQLFDCAETLGKMQRPAGGRLAIITNAGGLGVMAVDAFSKCRLDPPALSDATLEALNQFLPPMWSHANPIDLLGDALPEHYQKAVQVCLQAPEFQGLVVILSPQAMTDPTAVAKALAEVASRAKPMIAVWMGGRQVAEGIGILIQAGIPTFPAPEDAVDSFMQMYTYSRNLELLQETPPRLPYDLKVNTKQARTFIDECFKRGVKLLTEIESKAILSAYGIPVNHTVAASSAAAAVKAAKAMGFPVVLKIHSPDIFHKSEVDGVRTHLNHEEDVLAAYEEITAKAREVQPEANIYGVTVQTQVLKADLELILGSKRDPDFGPIILFGMGGVLTEAFRDTAVDLPPLNLLLARRLMGRTQVYRLLQGFRNIPPTNLEAVEEILVRLSQLVTDFPEIVELDINPLLIASGQPVAVDARLVIEESNVPAPRHLIISPYPNQYESDWLLRDGTAVLLRPMRPEDEPLVAEFLDSCSDDTIYSRYFHLIKRWSHQMLIRFTQNDYDREIGLTAFGQPPGPETMMGVCRLVMTPERDSGEFAVIVADPWHTKGLGQKLIERIIEIARENGVNLLYGEVLAANLPMLELVKKLGFRVTRGESDDIRRVEMKFSQQ